ncbi:hypothetical protein [Nonomuraea sp. NPDC049400]|uniref:hypothetical protein n=1 Tax=Nonomuraea sp. NPDC049400 TaxID=3364352 RepID=UPI0037B85A29
MKRDRTKRRLQPWRALPSISCERCERQALYRVGVASMVFDRGPSDSVTMRSGEFGALACDTHKEDLLDELCTEHGGSWSEPLKETWLGWLYGLPIISPIEVALHNWRFERSARRARAPK